MVMSEQSSDGKRDGARIFGVIFQFLAIGSIIATLYALARIASLGTALGVSNTNDPLIWIVLASGVFVTCVFLGMGYALGLLSAIYDRQEPSQPLVDVGLNKTIATRSAGSVPYRPSPITTMSEERHAPISPVERAAAPLLEQPVTPIEPTITEKSALWEWLTRERNFRQSQ